jgi:hypothetical protein
MHNSKYYYMMMAVQQTTHATSTMMPMAVHATVVNAAVVNAIHTHQDEPTCEPHSSTAPTLVTWEPRPSCSGLSINPDNVENVSQPSNCSALAASKIQG